MAEVKDMDIELRAAYCRTLMELAEKDPRVVVLEADLMKASGTMPFKDAFGKRAVDVGVAEADMVGIASGLSVQGFIPFAATFGCFAARRTFDQFFISSNYAKLNVKLTGTDPGVSAVYNGGTHMPFEDVGMMRLIPDLIIIDPSDTQSLYDLTIQAYATGKCTYTRTRRKGGTHRYAPGQVKLGKGNILADGKDLAIVATDEVIVNEAVKAVEMLAQKGIRATLVDITTIKPLDTDLLEKVSKETGHVLVCENARYAGGLGEAVAAHLARTYPAKMDFICVDERFGEVGKLDYLMKTFHLTAEDIAAKAEALARR